MNNLLAIQTGNRIMPVFIDTDPKAYAWADTADKQMR